MLSHQQNFLVIQQVVLTQQIFAESDYFCSIGTFLLTQSLLLSHHQEFLLTQQVLLTYRIFTKAAHFAVRAVAAADRNQMPVKVHTQ